MLNLQIVIAGGGLAGLAAAFRLASDGHDVHVYERSPKLSTASGAIFIRANAVSCLYSRGLKDLLTNRSSEIEMDQIRLGYTNDLMVRMGRPGYAALPDLATDRNNLQQLFFKLATEAGAKITFGTGIMDVDVDGTATLIDGTTIKADLILLADGISSRLRHRVVDNVSPIAMPSTHYPTEIPGEVLASNELTQSIADPVSNDSKDCILWVLDKGYVVCKYNPPTNVCCIMWSIQEADNDNPRLYDEVGDVNLVETKFASINPVLKALVNFTMDRGCSRWRLARLDHLETWHKGKVVLLGDSGHAMMPNAAQGYSCILEDIEALSILLESNLDTASAITAWQAIRKPRVERIQDLSLWRYGVYNVGEDPLKVAHQSWPDADWNADPVTVEQDGQAPFETPAFQKWLFDYNTTDETHAYLKRIRASELLH